jgi:uncharacterized protein (TIGR00251 family)
VSWLTATGEGVLIAVRAAPRAARDEVAGLHGDAIRIRLRAPPVEGKANEALVRYLADRLGVPARAVALVAGQTGRAKRVRVAGVTPERVRRALLV